jgi:hypothetical protein
MSRSVFVRFHRQTHDYVISQGVNNIVWLFNLNYWDPSGGLAWCRGSAYVDLVSLDSYPPGPNHPTVDNALLTTGKPIMYAGFGVNSPQSSGSGDYTTVLATIKANYANIFCQQDDSDLGDAAARARRAVPESQ